MSFESLFESIRNNREDGASTLARKTLLIIKDYILRHGTSNINQVLDCAKTSRASMPIIKNSILKLEDKFRECRKPEDFLKSVDEVISHLEVKRKKIFEMGLLIIRDFRNIGVVSFSSNIKEILSALDGKRILALVGDKHAQRFGENVEFFEDDKFEENIDVGIMGADAILIGRKVSVVNGYPSLRFVQAVMRKKIFVFAESEKITKEEEYITEEGFDRFEIRENIYIAIV